MSKVAQDPIEHSPLTQDTWKFTTTGNGLADIVWLGEENLLVYRRDASFVFYSYDRRPRARTADPFTKVVGGSWASKGFDAATRFLSLGGRRILTWQPTSETTSTWRLWRWTPGAADPLGSAPIAKNTFGSIGSVKRMLYLGNDRVLAWEPTTFKSSGVNLFRVVRDPKNDGDPLPAHGNWVWPDIDDRHELVLLSPDRLLAWEPAKGTFRVFEVDRAKVASASPLFGTDIIKRPHLADGPWSDIKAEDGRRTQTLVWSLPTEGRRLMTMERDRVLDFQPHSGAAFIWPTRRVEKIADGPTDIDGISIKHYVPDTGEGAPEQRRPGVVVDLRKVFPDAMDKGQWVGPTVAELAKTVGLSPDDVMADIVHLEANASGAFQALMSDKLSRNVSKSASDRANDARLLLEAGVALVKFGVHGYQWETTVEYDLWRVQTASVLLRVTSQSMAVIDVKAKQNARATRLAQQQEHWDKLTAMLDDKSQDGLLNLLESLTAANDAVEKHTASASAELGLLRTLEIIARLMQESPTLPLSSRADGNLTTLRSALDRLITLHTRDTIETPKWLILETAKQAQRELADKLLTLIKQPGLIDHSMELAANLDIAPRKLACRVYDRCRNIYTELLKTHVADELVRLHVQPSIEHVCSIFNLTYEANAFEFPENPSFNEELRSRKVEPPGPRTWLGALITQGADLTKASDIAPVLQFVQPVAGNAPGPASLFGAILTIDAPRLLHTNFRLHTNAGRDATKLFKCVSWVAGLNREDSRAAMQALRRGRLTTAREKFSSAQSGPKWTVLLIALNVITLLNAVKANEKGTQEQWLAIVIASANTGGAAAQGLQHISKAFDLTRLADKLEAGGKALGFIGAAVTYYVSAKAAVAEWGKGDTYGQVLAWTATLGAALSLLGLACGSTGVGVLPGAVLMYVGAALSIGSSLASYVRDKTTTSTHDLFKHYLVEMYEKGFVRITFIENGAPVERLETPFSWARERSKELDAAYEAVKSAQSFTVNGWMPTISVAPLKLPPLPGQKVELTGLLALCDAGLTNETVAKITDTTEAKVKAELEDREFREFPRP